MIDAGQRGTLIVAVAEDRTLHTLRGEVHTQRGLSQPRGRIDASHLERLPVRHGRETEDVDQCAQLRVIQLFARDAVVDGGKAGRERGQGGDGGGGKHRRQRPKRRGRRAAEQGKGRQVAGCQRGHQRVIAERVNDQRHDVLGSSEQRCWEQIGRQRDEVGREAKVLRDRRGEVGEAATSVAWQQGAGEWAVEKWLSDR